jgi:polyisoprenoid-binding protein YceI
MDTSNIDLFVYTDREGALSAVGHDLKLRANRFAVDRDGDHVHVAVKSDSLTAEARVLDSGEKPVSLVDRKVIERNAAKDVLKASKYPEIVYDGTIADRTDDGFQLEGKLTLLGKTAPLTVAFAKSDGRWRGEAVIHQPDWGIKPYKTMLGALKIKPEVRVEVFVDDV